MDEFKINLYYFNLSFIINLINTFKLFFLFLELYQYQS